MTETDDTLGKIYFFTNIRNLTGDKITHRWSYKDKVKAEIGFNIKGKRWRVWSIKIFGTHGQESGKLKCSINKMKFY
ncbi:DUF2914 domain-containing protein [Isorropodon fossajaponicum symbiont]|uniref:DUF2914 domain-containing protein n=1 Tax=Isorropodon fossajaponicum symbiont TaxID=883811 RepID=UPI003CC99A52